MLERKGGIENGRLQMANGKLGGDARAAEGVETMNGLRDPAAVRLADR